jgi:hypothetical protein
MYALDKKKNGKAGSTLANDIVFVDLDVEGLLTHVPNLDPKDVYSKYSEFPVSKGLRRGRKSALHIARKKRPLLPVNGLNRKGESALHIATEKSLLPNVCLLLAHGADINIQNSETGDTPLHYAVAGHWKEGIRLLLAKSRDVNIQNNKTGDTPLHYAATSLWKEGIELLLEKDAYVNVKNSKTGETPLHYAVAGHWKEGIGLLLAKGGNVNIQNHKTGDTPLYYAAAGHWKEGIELLLEKGADRKIANDQGLLPRDIAVRSGKRISKLEPSAVSRFFQTIRFGFGKDLNMGGSGQPDLTDKVKRSSKMRKAGG